MNEPDHSCPRHSRFIIPLVIIILGVAWLLTSLRVLPQINWVFVLILALSGLLMLIIRPLSRARLIGGLILLSVAVGRVCLALGLIEERVLVPVLVILSGGYALIGQCLPLAHRPEPTSEADGPTATDGD